MVPPKKFLLKLAPNRCRAGGGAYSVRQQSEAYARDFASESDALMPENTIS